jgi:hypothetical protein
MLCDSVGITPKPNNGTLRLPLKPIGTHADEETIEEPQDPVPPNEVQSTTPASSQSVESEPSSSTPVSETPTSISEPDDSDSGDGSGKSKVMSFFDFLKESAEEVWTWGKGVANKILRTPTRRSA